MDSYSKRLWKITIGCFVLGYSFSSIVFLILNAQASILSIENIAVGANAAYILFFLCFLAEFPHLLPWNHRKQTTT